MAVSTNNNSSTNSINLSSTNDLLASPGLTFNHKQVTLVSNDHAEFIVDTNCVLQSETLKMLLTSSTAWKERETGRLVFPSVDSRILAKVVEYLNYRYASECASEKDPSLSVKEFMIEPDMALDLMLAADFLDV